MTRPSTLSELRRDIIAAVALLLRISDRETFLKDVAALLGRHQPTTTSLQRSPQ